MRNTSTSAATGKPHSLTSSYDAAEDNEISFKEGERITEIEKPDADWWQGKSANGQVGLFPGELCRRSE